MRLKVRCSSCERMSNKHYHRDGKPTWWCYVVVDGVNRFVELPDNIRGDFLLDLVGAVEVPGPGEYRIVTGVGPISGGIRERDTLYVWADRDGKLCCAYTPQQRDAGLALSQTAQFDPNI